MRELGQKNIVSPQHPALQEWIRWRQEEPMRFSCAGDMPIEMALAFDWLLENYGRGSLNAVADAHNQALALMQSGNG